MTVSSETSRKTFAGNGVTTSFATSPMVFFDSEDLTVYVVTTATSAVLSTLVEGTDYSVTGGDGSTGTISTAGGSDPYGAPATGTTLVIVREVAITQESDFVNNDNSDAEVVEAALDRLTMIAQQAATLAERTLRLADSDVSGASVELPAPSAGGLFRWNAAGDAVEYLDIDPVSEIELFTQSGGGVPRSWTSKVAEIVSVTDYGAACNGTTDDTAAVNAAFAQVGRFVFIPKGGCKISSNLAPPTCAGIFGEGWQIGTESYASALNCQAGVTVGLELRGGSQINRPYVLRDFMIRGAGVSIADNSVGLLIGNSNTTGTPDYKWEHGHVSNVRITGWGDGTNADGCIGMYLRDSNWCSFYDVLIDNCTAWLWSSSACAANTNTPADVSFYNLRLKSQGTAGVKAVQIASGAMRFFNTKVNLCQDICYYIAAGNTGACPAFASYAGPQAATAIDLGFYTHSIEDSGSSASSTAMFYIDAETIKGSAHVTLRDLTTDSASRLLLATGASCHVLLDNLIDYAGAGMTAASTNYIRALAAAHITVANWGATNDSIPALSTAASVATAGLIDSPNWPLNYTATATGYTTAPTGTVLARKNGNVVALDVPQFSATNNGQITLTGMPAALRPATAKNLLCVTSNNGGADTVSLLVIATNGTMSFYTSPAGASWAGAGTGILRPFSVTYTTD